MCKAIAGISNIWISIAELLTVATEGLGRLQARVHRCYGLELPLLVVRNVICWRPVIIGIAVEISSVVLWRIDLTVLLLMHR